MLALTWLPSGSPRGARKVRQLEVDDIDIDTDQDLLEG
jgi:hypothetical protein